MAPRLPQSPALPVQRQQVRRPLSAARRPLQVTAASSAAAPAPTDNRKLRLKLRSYLVPLLNEAVELIQTAAAETGAKMSGPVPLPNRRRIYTVLRSPHVNKDAREQFERRTHFRLMDLKNLSAGTIDRLMALDLPAGVDIDVKLL